MINDMSVPADLVRELAERYGGNLSLTSRETKTPLGTLVTIKDGAQPKWDTMCRLVTALGYSFTDTDFAEKLDADRDAGPVLVQ